MHTQNVKTAAHESSERWGAKTIRHIFERASYNVACAEEAHAHDRVKFTRLDACFYFTQGAVEAWIKVIRHALRKGGRNVLGEVTRKKHGMRK